MRSSMARLVHVVLSYSNTGRAHAAYAGMPWRHGMLPKGPLSRVAGAYLACGHACLTLAVDLLLKAIIHCESTVVTHPG